MTDKKPNEFQTPDEDAAFMEGLERRAEEARGRVKLDLGRIASELAEAAEEISMAVQSIEDTRERVLREIDRVNAHQQPRAEWEGDDSQRP